MGPGLDVQAQAILNCASGRSQARGASRFARNTRCSAERVDRSTRSGAGGRSRTNARHPAAIRRPTPLEAAEIGPTQGNRHEALVECERELCSAKGFTDAGARKGHVAGGDEIQGSRPRALRGPTTDKLLVFAEVANGRPMALHRDNRGAAGLASPDGP